MSESEIKECLLALAQACTKQAMLTQRLLDTGALRLDTLKHAEMTKRNDEIADALARACSVLERR